MGIGALEGKSSMTTIPMRIRAAPKIERRPRCSCRTRNEVMHAKTGSKLRRIAVWVGGRYCWAQLWIVNAAAVARRLVMASAVTRRGVRVRCGLPPKGRVIAISSAADPIWRVARWAVGMAFETWAKDSRWAAKATAQNSVRMSPRPTVLKRFCQEVPAGVVRRKRPEKAEMAPTALVQRGAGVPEGRSAGKIVNRGTKTTTRPVMRADFAAVVWARPAVWN